MTDETTWTDPPSGDGWRELMNRYDEGCAKLVLDWPEEDPDA